MQNAHQTDIEVLSSMIPGIDIMSPAGYLKAVREGVTGSSLKHIVNTVGLREMFVRVLHTDSSNLSKHYRKAKLDLNMSDDVIGTLRLIIQAANVYDSSELAYEWLKTPIPALGGEKPIDLMDTHAGRNLVEQALRKITRGEYS